MKTGAIIVLYKPEIALLSDVLKSCVDQVDGIFLVDNTPAHLVDKASLASCLSLSDKLVYIALGDNMGIASAQNEGISLCRKSGYDKVLLLDQDSVLTPGMVKTLEDSYQYLSDKGHKVGAVGPFVYSRQSGQVYEAVVDKGEQVTSDIVAIKQLISSGSLISLTTLADIGGLEDRLFIDAVDFEWCWRAGKAGYEHFKVRNALIQHMFGDDERKVLGVKTSIPSAFRCYYLYRNYLWLLRRSYVPLYWKATNGVKFALKFVYYSIFLKQRKEYFSSIVRGIAHGIKP